MSERGGAGAPGSDAERKHDADRENDADLPAGNGRNEPAEENRNRPGEEAQQSEYPAAANPEGSPQEPVSEDEPKPDEEDRETTEEYPAGPSDTGGGAEPHKDRREGPGAARAQDPHEHDAAEQARREQQAVTTPPAPGRPPGGPSDSTQRLYQASPAAARPQDRMDHTEQLEQTSGQRSAPQQHTHQRQTAVWSDSSVWEPSSDAAPTRLRQRRKKSKAPLVVGLAVGLTLLIGIVLLGILVTNWLQDAGPEAQSAGSDVVAEDVSPFDFRQGQCFTDFADATQGATVVQCDTPHEAQLVNTFFYEDDAEFPGEEALIARADELCRTTQLNEAAEQYDLRQQTAYPQPESWAQGDRRVDCFIRTTGEDLTESLIN